MDNKIKLLALDLDGTVLRSNNTLSDKVKSAIESAYNSGITIAAASGRPFSSMPMEILDMPEFEYYIASNGAAIYDSKGKKLRSVTLKEKDVIKILKLTEDYDLIWEAFLDGETCTDVRYYNDPMSYGCTAAYVDYVRSSRGTSDDMRGYIYKNRGRLDSIEFVSTDNELRRTLWDKIESNVDSVYVTTSSKHFVEIMDGSATKANALRYICDLLNIPLENVAAAGNADNDIDMIVEAGLGAAVKNASPKCLGAADFIVESNDNDGIVELIEMIRG